jgi:hypothetical protein
MNSEIEAAEKAEFIQSVKALLIPLSLFLACVIMAAGTFLIYNREPLGWAFAALSTVIIIAAIVAFIRFQNKHRARGILKHGTEAEVVSEVVAQPDFEPDLEPDLEPITEPIAENELTEPSNVVEFKAGKQRLNH